MSKDGVGGSFVKDKELSEIEIFRVKDNIGIIGERKEGIYHEQADLLG